jgi:GT2 family glycosyltransferase
MSASKNPLVSVVVATCDRPDYLRIALASAINNEYRNLQIIVADDGGSDTNRSVAESFGDSRILYHRNETRLGIAGNHIHAFRKLVNGEFVAVLNDDDAWEPSFLSRMLPIFVNSDEVVLAFSDHHVMDERGRVDKAATERNTRHWRRDSLAPGLHRPFWQLLFEMTIPVAQASVIRRSAIDWEDFPAEVGAAWDYWLGYLACRTGMACYYLPERLTAYRVHPASVTVTSSQDGALGKIILYSRIMEIPELAGIRDQIRLRSAEAHLQRALFLLKVRRVREARVHVRESISLSGINPRAAAVLGLASMPPMLGRAALDGLRSLRRQWRG